MIPPAPRNAPYNISESITKVKGFVERDNEIMTILKNKVYNSRDFYIFKKEVLKNNKKKNYFLDTRIFHRVWRP